MTGAPDVEDYFSLFDETTGITLPEEFGVGESNPDDLNNKFLGDIDFTDNFVPFDSLDSGSNFEQESELNWFFSELYAGNFPDARTSLDNMADALAFFYSDVDSGSGGPFPSSNSIRRHLGDFLREIFNVTRDSFGSIDNLGDIETLYQALGGSAEFGSRQGFFDEFEDNSFNSFLLNYDFTIPSSVGASFGDGGLPIGNVPDYRIEFQRAVESFYGLRVGAEDAPSNALDADLTSYEKIFNEFVPQPPLIPFEEVLADFYNDKVAQDGYFLPSHHLRDWITTVRQQQLEQSGLATSVAGTNSQKTLILLQLFRLLVEVIEVLQRVAAAQGQRLQFYAEVQRAYTNLIGEIPIINEEDVRRATDGSGTSFTRTVSPILSFTQAQNQSFTEKLRALRSVFGDEARQHQTTVNQSNEIVTQQANLGTSILQQLSTILTTMFK